jgi:S-formylglutathione hydrolase
MGGHGALVIALRNPQRYRSVSAFAPIAAPSHSPWGRKAFSGYLGADEQAWREYDATALVESRGWAGPPILIDQGTADAFLGTQLMPERFAAACRRAGVALDLHLREGYDHSYCFIATFVEAHLRHHARYL